MERTKKKKGTKKTVVIRAMQRDAVETTHK